MLSSGEKINTNTNMNRTSYLPRPSTVDRRWKPNVEVAPNCPRCDSSNTKFCYYNNYSLTQPRYFCKGCRRYWTKGGSLRNVPVGGGCRKNSRGKLVRSTDQNSSRQITSSSAQSRKLLGNSIPPDILVDNPPIGKGSTGPLSSSTDTSNSDVSAIDLAVLYARFSNQEPEFESTGLTGASDHQLPLENYNRAEFTGTLNSDYQTTSISGIDCQIPPLVPTAEVQLGSEFPHSEFDFNFNTGVSCGSQYLIDEGLISTDIFWSGGCSPTTISNSIWQQTAFHTQYGFVPPLEDPSYQNLTNTNWNTFDSSTYEARS